MSRGALGDALRRLLGRGTAPAEDPRVAALRRQLRAACASNDRAQLERLLADDSTRDLADAVELELELADGVLAALELERRTITSGELPVVVTNHRVVGPDTCHFVAPATRHPGDPLEAGKLLLTNRRLIYVGSASVRIPWSRGLQVSHDERDLVVVRGRDRHSRFRCNTYSDARCAAFAAGWLTAHAG